MKVFEVGEVVRVYNRWFDLWDLCEYVGVDCFSKKDGVHLVEFQGDFVRATDEWILSVDGYNEMVKEDKCKG